MILVTGSAGFIGSNFVLEWCKRYDENVISIDKLTYAGNLANLDPVIGKFRHTLYVGDICNAAFLDELIAEHKPSAIINFAAESHVDNSIESPGEFIQTNIVGTFTLLEATRKYYSTLSGYAKDDFRFLHVSTDEVYGSLGEFDPAFTETTRYEPNSPYSASKAASDHLVRAYFHTYGLPVLTTNCSNNYGPRQHTEKLVPKLIANALQGKPLPIYGDGLNIRDWLYVTDHCDAILEVLQYGRIGEVYNIGGWNEQSNYNIVKHICSILDELVPTDTKYIKLIQYVSDRPGHDRRYAIDASKIYNELGWKPKETFESGIRKTIEWYLQQQKSI